MDPIQGTGGEQLFLSKHLHLRCSQIRSHVGVLTMPELLQDVLGILVTLTLKARRGKSVNGIFQMFPLPFGSGALSSY